MILFLRKFNHKEFTKHVRKISLLHNDIEYINKERIEFVKNENKKGKGVLLFMNHFTALDPLFLYDFIDYFSVAKSDLIGNIDGSWLFDYVREEFFDGLKLIPYKRGDRQSGEAIKETILEMIQKGKNIIVFPEGECQHCFKKPKPFKKGILELAHENNIPIFSISINFSKDIGYDRHEPVDVLGTLEKSSDVRIYLNGMFYPYLYKDWNDLHKDVYKSIADNVLLEWTD